MLTIINKLLSVFGQNGFQLDNITVPYLAKDDSELDMFHLSGRLSLSDCLTEEQIDAITKRAEKSIAQVNSRLAESRRPKFSEVERFTMHGRPVREWDLVVWADLETDIELPCTLQTYIGIDTESGVIPLLTNSYWFGEASADYRFVLAKNEMSVCVKNLYKHIYDAVNVEEYADSECFTVDTLPLDHAHDAVRQFSDYPKSIDKKLHIR
jgi:hypothetical protein